MDLFAWLEPRLNRLEAHLKEALADAWPEPFRTALQYPVFGGGKRVRPALVFAAYDALRPGEDMSPALPAAAAVELIHTYSLVHDDLPCMDDDAVRRGRPTVHVAFGEASAMLVGDALLTEAFAVLARAPWTPQTRIEAVRCLADAAGHRGMVGGQAADIGLGGPVTSVDALERLHAGKTGALIQASAVLGGLAAGADSGQLDALARYGARVGLAFQLADDVLDAEQDAGQEDVPSFVTLLGEEETRRRANQLVDEAQQVLAGLGRDLPFPAALDALARFVVDRDV